MHANRTATAPATVPAAALGPGVLGLEPLTGPPATLADGTIALPGDAGVAVYAILTR